MLGILFAACPAYCSTYYVDPNGNDTTGDGSIGSPYKTIGKGVSVAAAGDTIYVRRGTFTYSGSTTAITLPSKSGASASNRCYLMGYNGERPLLDFSAMTGTSADGLLISGSYWYVKGIDCKGAPHNGIKIGGSGATYNTVEFCRAFENRNTGVGVASGAAHNQIINCDSYYNYNAPDGGNADGFAPKIDVGTGNYFYGCRAWQNSDDGYDGYLRPSDDVNTTYINCWAFKNGYLKDANSSVHGNGNGFKMGGSDSPRLLRHNVILKNCLSFQNYKEGFDQNHNKGSMTLHNCTAFSNGSNNFEISEALASGKTATVINCISFTGTVSLAYATQTTNSWQSPFVVTSADFVSTDPSAAYGSRNADGSLPNITFMHLAAGSDLIDGGTDVGLPYNGSAPDLGCFETGGSSPPGAASNPTPTNGATGVSITQDLGWTAGSGATSHDVYFGTSSPGTLRGNQTATTFDTGTMSNNTTYYWRIDEKNAGGTTTGIVWSFTTIVAPPGQASSPSPSTGATGVSITQDLGWTAGSGATSHDVYFGTSSPGTLRGNQTATTFDTGTMSNNTTYYWRIDEKNAGGTTTGIVWSFTTIVAPPGQASSPSPSTGATGVSITQDLGWTAGSGATSHDVYFGTSSPGTLRGNQTATTFDTGTMSNNTTYYWRIDEKNAGGTTTGIVWSFTTIVAPPGQATSPSPSTGATGVSITQDLGWTAGSGATSRDVYFGTAASPPQVSTSQTATTFDTGTMASLTTYYWRIDEKNASGTTTGTVWNFTTSDTTPPEAPTGLTVILPGEANVPLDWNDNSEGDLAGYNVYRSETSGSGYSKLNSSLLTSSDYTDNITTHDTTYYYVVTAVDTNSNESDDSNEVFGGLYGDFTGNGIVEIADLPDFLDYWLEDDCYETAGLDLDDNCIVNFYEFSVLAENWLK